MPDLSSKREVIYVGIWPDPCNQVSGLSLFLSLLFKGDFIVL